MAFEDGWRRSGEDRAARPDAKVARARELRRRFREVRAATEGLCAPLDPEDAAAQSMPDASPVKWHLAHTTWFFETFVLERSRPGYEPFHPAFRDLFNSYYQTVGDPYPRPERGLLTRPSLEQVRSYRNRVDSTVLDLLRDAEREPAVETVLDVVELGLHHEQQHQELILTDLKHLFSRNPLRPAYREEPRAEPEWDDAKPGSWVGYSEGVYEIGDAGRGFAFDNERPRHRVYLAPFELASRLATNAEFLAFLEDGGYRRPELWLSDGWNAVEQNGWRAPLYWEEQDGRWFVFTLSGMRPLQLSEPVCHVSYYEAEAFARWMGARLPSEAEWEVAAASTPDHGHFVESGALHPKPLPARAGEPAQLFGDVWEWTQSAYLPYPGYAPPEGALGEYNGKFMANQMVLRGGSCATPRSHVRVSYRNFFYPDARWQFSGLRLARDAR